jgi:hypothetical protein
MNVTTIDPEAIFAIQMIFQGAHYRFDVFPEQTTEGIRYNVLRDRETVFHIFLEGDLWVDASSRESTAFIRELGHAIELGQNHVHHE